MHKCVSVWFEIIQCRVQIVLQDVAYIKPLKEVFAASLALHRDLTLKLLPPGTASQLSSVAFELPVGGERLRTWSLCGPAVPPAASRCVLALMPVRSASERSIEVRSGKVDAVPCYLSKSN